MRHTRAAKRCIVAVAATFGMLGIPGTASAHPLHVWTPQMGTMPAKRAYAAMANFPGIGLVMYGGCWISPCPTDTWKWTGTSWTQMSASGGPTFCTNSQMVYDSSNTRLVLVCPSFAGPPTGTHVAVYTFDGTTWTDRTFVSTLRPPERQHFVLTYDVAAARVVLFGGFANNGQIKNDTWELNPTTFQWEETHAQGSPTAPPPRYAAAAAYHLTSGKSVVFGGGPHGGPQPTDTWGYDASGSVNTWTQLATVGPTERWKSVMSYDPTHNQVLLHGGFNLTANLHLNDTWAWDGAMWVAQPPGGPLRYGAAMAYHPPSNKTVLFGGAPPPGGTTDETHVNG